MALDIEAAELALFSRLATAANTPFKTTTRILEDWDSKAPAKQPALMQTALSLEPFTPNEQLQGLGRVLWKVHLLLVIYAEAPDSKVAPLSLLNPLIAFAVNALMKTQGEARAPGGAFNPNLPGQAWTTLGGLCVWCRVSGAIDRFEGLIGHTAVAHIPLEMVLSS